MMDQYSIWTVLKKYYKWTKGKRTIKLPTYRQLMEEEAKKWEAIHNQPKEDEPFKGMLKAMSIATYPSPYLLLPDIDRYQLLTIDRQGNVYFERALPSRSWNIRKRVIKKCFNIPINDAEKVLNCISEYFKKLHKCLIYPDCGYWEIILENTDGVRYKSTNILSRAYSSEEKENRTDDYFIAEVECSEELHEMNLLIKKIIKNKAIIAFGE